MAIRSCNAYLTFNGECRAAFEFYRGVFGGEFQVLSTFADGPAGMAVPAAFRDHVLHVSLPLGDGLLMGSDAGPHSPPITVGSNFSLSVATGSREESDTLLAKLSADGAVTMPMAETFWGAYFGMCRDQFGINWMVAFEAGGE